MTIGERIKFKREELDISQDELARRLGYKSRSSINKIELGLQNLNQSKIRSSWRTSGTASTIWKTPGGRKRGRSNALSARVSFCERT